MKIKEIWTLEEVKDLISAIIDQQPDPYPHPEEHYSMSIHNYRDDYWNNWLEDYCNNTTDKYITLTSTFNSLQSKEVNHER